MSLDPSLISLSKWYSTHMKAGVVNRDIVRPPTNSRRLFSLVNAAADIDNAMTAKSSIACSLTIAIRYGTATADARVLNAGYIIIRGCARGGISS
jgi:hypothetical protein